LYNVHPPLSVPFVPAMTFRRTISVLAVLCAVILFVFEAYGQRGFEPLGMQLTWQRDPTSTMTIDWHVEQEHVALALFYRRRDTADWTEVAGSTHAFPLSNRQIRRVELTNLGQDTYYEFRIGSEGRTFGFRTMPREADRPIRIAIGGDVRHRQEWMDRTNRVAAGHDPDFVVFGGDLAYADSNPRRIGRWYEWFESTMRTLRTSEGRLIPVVAAIGNHEVWSDAYAREEPDPDAFIEEFGLIHGQPKFYFDLFPFPGRPGYNVLDFGEYLSLLILDTEHVNYIAGTQTAWLNFTLAARRHVPHVFPVYHVPAYPSVRAFETLPSARVREHWVPLFERYGVEVAFESHDHAYKRTHPIRQGRIDPEGIVYVGDGAWGVETRPIGRDHPEPAWYLDRAESVRHFVLLTIDGGSRHMSAIDEFGVTFDELPTHTARSVELRAERRDLSVYPNPASKSVVVEFVLGDAQTSSVHVYDALGRRVATALEATHLSAGLHVIPLEIGFLPPGGYVVRVRMGDERISRRLTVRP
jgi:acid phosphatase type 7